MAKMADATRCACGCICADCNSERAMSEKKPDPTTPRMGEEIQRCPDERFNKATPAEKFTWMYAEAKRAREAEERLKYSEEVLAVALSDTTDHLAGANARADKLAEENERLRSPAELVNCHTRCSSRLRTARELLRGARPYIYAGAILPKIDAFLAEEDQ